MIEETIKELEQRLELLEHKRANLKNEIASTEREMAEIKNSLASLRRLANLMTVGETLREISNAATGMTDAIRESLKVTPNQLSIAEIKAALEAAGYDTSQHSNSLASIHSCIKRLVNRGEVLKSEVDGKTVYEWKR